MKTSLTCLIFLFQVIFPAFIEVEIQNAVELLKNRKEVIQDITRSWTSPTEEIVAIVSPELIRYNLLRDFFETQALELAYVSFGQEGADFSIGYFQMKPSFIEDLEAYVLKNPSSYTSYSDITYFPVQNEKKKRKIRLDRLKNFEWQLNYAHAFYQIVSHRFPQIQQWATEERIAFIASAYNFGFQESACDIEEWQCIEAFPYGKQFYGYQASYAEVAIAFYPTISLIF